MEGWLYGLFALLGVLFGGLFSYLGIKKQIGHSDKRLEKELARAREENQQKRRWEVRGQPLLELRAELARMGNKQDKLVSAAHRQLVVIGGTEEERKKELQGAVDDWNDYMASGDYGQTLFMQYDIELINKAVEILKDYQESYFSAVYYKQASAEELKKSMKVFERNKVRIIEVQELINKRLEEL